VARTRGETGEAAAGIAMTERCNVTSDALGAQIFRPHLLGFEAELHGLAGTFETGLDRIAQALERVEATTERFAEAELHRMRGDLLLLRRPPAEGEAEASFREAIAVARRQDARSWELRAATSLARLLSAQGQGAEARRVLAPVYERFTEGFDTRDLREAKAVLGL